MRYLERDCPVCDSHFQTYAKLPTTYCSRRCYDMARHAKRQVPVRMEITDNPAVLAMSASVATDWTVQRISDGQIWKAHNLRRWCRENPDLFDPETWLAAYEGIKNVRTFKRTGRISHWKDFTVLD